jgi:hypothetical protein
MLSDGSRFALEVKEKRQAYTVQAWPQNTPEAHMFILDDLTVRKCLGFAPRAGVAVKDVVGKRFVFYSVIDLALMPRVRVNRRIERNKPDLGQMDRGLRNGKRATTLDDLLVHLQVIWAICSISTNFTLVTASISARSSARHRAASRTLGSGCAQQQALNHGKQPV